MTEQQVVDLIASTLGVPGEKVERSSRAEDFPEWDSMGALTLVTMLDRQGVRIQPEEIGRIQSVEGIISAFREAGKLP